MDQIRDKYNKIKSTLPKIIVNMVTDIETMRQNHERRWRFSGLQMALESEMKCQVMSAKVDAVDAYIVADYVGLSGHWERIEPFHVAMNREAHKKFLDRR